jgi:hypothetical protein
MSPRWPDDDFPGAPHMYVLGGDDGRTPVPCRDVRAWGRWYEAVGEGRRVAIDDLGGGLTVSTVFLGLDHGFGGRRPLLFETMVFRERGGDFPEGDETWRYATWGEAERGHRSVVTRMRSVLAARGREQRARAARQEEG